MPAVSKKQQKLMGLALHNPSKVSKKNRDILKMSGEQLMEFAETRRKGLPNKVKKGKK